MHNFRRQAQQKLNFCSVYCGGVVSREPNSGKNGSDMYFNSSINYNKAIYYDKNIVTYFISFSNIIIKITKQLNRTQKRLTRRTNMPACCQSLLSKMHLKLDWYDWYVPFYAWSPCCGINMLVNKTDQNVSTVCSLLPAYEWFFTLTWSGWFTNLAKLNHLKQINVDNSWFSAKSTLFRRGSK